MTHQIRIKERCPTCNKDAIVTDAETGEMICGICGFVMYERLIDSGQEWRSFLDDKTNKARTGDGTFLTIHDKGLSTIINPANKDSTGKPLSYSMKSSIKRLRIWDSRTKSHESIDRNFQRAFTELHRMKDKLAVSDAVVEKAAYIYRKAMDKKLVRGRSISAMIAASLYAACRDSGTPRTLNDLSTVANIIRRDLTLCYRLLVRELDLKMPVVDSKQCISRIASIAGLSEKTKRYAIKILNKAEESQSLAGKDPMGLAASALYLASHKRGEKISQKQVAIASGVTEVTIRNSCKGLRLLEI